jgi:hypothetical protein
VEGADGKRMALIKNYEQFKENIKNKCCLQEFRELSAISGDGYFIEISFADDNILLEYESVKRFAKTDNRYYYHSASSNPLVKAHYHIIPSNGNYELYAVNIDGTAHHRVNKGYIIPQKEADELRKLGVDIKDNRIIEHILESENGQKKLLTESLNKNNLTILIEIDYEDNTERN